ncbi:MAG: 16S rRNA (cytosine(1402)-N(4))-methyltransferase RsmH [Planctomycetota bacterium]|nr:16S rRNA (cytosine(1402)-N(4))-methyltransferase RsmH [Planctomycetota bacterium]
MSESVHIPVLLDECLESLRIHPEGIYVDGTFGGGGHSRAIVERLGGTGQVISIDQDPAVFERASSWIVDQPIQQVHANFRRLPSILKELEIPQVDGILLDLGLSSDQLADDQRGFSFQAEGDLDLRFDPTRGEPAWKLVNRLSAKHLADLIYQNGEERFSRRIASKIVEIRKDRPFRQLSEFVALVRSCVPRSRNHSIDPATRTLQALRIAVNDELGSLDDALKCFPDLLKPGGRFSVISFHSLEDRRVKNAFRDDPRLEKVTRKPVVASEEELVVNSRAKSAKLRVAQKN